MQSSVLSHISSIATNCVEAPAPVSSDLDHLNLTQADAEAAGLIAFIDLLYKAYNTSGDSKILAEINKTVTKLQVLQAKINTLIITEKDSTIKQMSRAISGFITRVQNHHFAQGAGYADWSTNIWIFGEKVDGHYQGMAGQITEDFTTWLKNRALKPDDYEAEKNDMLFGILMLFIDLSTTKGASDIAALSENIFGFPEGALISAHTAYARFLAYYIYKNFPSDTWNSILTALYTIPKSDTEHPNTVALFYQDPDGLTSLIQKYRAGYVPTPHDIDIIKTNAWQDWRLSI